MDVASLPRASRDAVLEARMRGAPEDFVVEELPGFEPSGAGEHLLLEIEKTGRDTAEVARHLAGWAGVDAKAIGYAGRKDRHAVSRQRFSVHLPRRVAPDLPSAQAPGIRVLGHAWHRRKLPRGALAGNRFELVLRAVRGRQDDVDARLAQIARHGCPNYFGAQRFGRDGTNVEMARRMFAGQRVPRDRRSLLLSAARSELFNRVLARRVLDGSWASGLDGELWSLDGSRSVFGPVPLDAVLAARAERLDIHPSGPLWGRGPIPAGPALATLEHEVLAGDADLREGLEAAGLRQERRSLRLRVGELRWHWDDPETLALSFRLPAGAYATALLHELGAVHDAHVAEAVRGSG